MLAIRLQRTGRKGHAQFRVIVQEARRSPSSGNVVAALGNYNPHSKAVVIDTEKAAFYLNNGAQPSPRVAVLLQKEGVKLPSWVTIDSGKKSSIKHTEKLRRNRPAGEAAPVAKEPAPEEAAEVTEPAAEAPTEVSEEASTEVAAENDSEKAEETTTETATEEEAPTETQEANSAPAETPETDVSTTEVAAEDSTKNEK